MSAAVWGRRQGLRSLVGFGRFEVARGVIAAGYGTRATVTATRGFLLDVASARA